MVPNRASAKAATVTTGVGGQIAVTLAIVLSLGLMLIGVSAHTVVGYVLAFVAAFFAAANVVGGYAVTGRMLKMFRRKTQPAPPEIPGQAQVQAASEPNHRS